MTTSSFSERVYTTGQLVGLSAQQLDDLFAASPAGPIPTGNTNGKAIIAPGTPIAGILALVVRLFFWQGKVFDPEQGILRNKVSPIGFKSVVAKVYRGESWFDGKECIVIDYSQTSKVAQFVRDEIRMVSPGVYLGVVFQGSKKTINFALSTTN